MGKIAAYWVTALGKQEMHWTWSSPLNENEKVVVIN